jgi:aconitate hydratase 2/2-methylisocitrate dehydratase
LDGKQASPYVPFVNIAPIVGGTNGISPIFLTTVDVTGGIGIDLQNWVKKVDENGNPVRNENGDILRKIFCCYRNCFDHQYQRKKLYNGELN